MLATSYGCGMQLVPLMMCFCAGMHLQTLKTADPEAQRLMKWLDEGLTAYAATAEKSHSWQYRIYFYILTSWLFVTAAK